MKRILVLMLLISLLVSCKPILDYLVYLDDLKRGNTIGDTIKIIDHGCDSGYSLCGGMTVNEVTLLKINSKDEFDKFWSLHKSNIIPKISAPFVNFTKKMILVIMCPVYSTGGYDVAIDEINLSNYELVVAATHKSPGMNCILLDVFTQPYIIIEIDSSNLPIVLNLTKIIINCR